MWLGAEHILHKMLLNALHQDLIDAQKSGDGIKISTLRYLLAELKNREIELRYLQNTGKGSPESFNEDGSLSDKEVLSVIQKQIKQRIESMAAYRLGNRQDLVNKETTEMTILEGYLPPQLLAEDVEVEVRKIIEVMPEKDRAVFGLVMRAAMSQLHGRTDGVVVQTAVKKVLGI